MVGQDSWQGLIDRNLSPSTHITVKAILSKSMFPQLARFTGFGLPLLRLMVAVVFLTSGYGHLTHSAERAKSIGMWQGFTILLGAAEVAGGLGVTFGVLTQLPAIGLILIMLGSISMKTLIWHMGFRGEKSYGWHSPDVREHEFGDCIYRWRGVCVDR